MVVMILEEMRQIWAKRKPAMWLGNYPYGLGKGLTITLPVPVGLFLPSAWGICSLSQRDRTGPPVCFQNSLVLSSSNQVGTCHGLRGIKAQDVEVEVLLEVIYRMQREETLVWQRDQNQPCWLM